MKKTHDWIKNELNSQFDSDELKAFSELIIRHVLNYSRTQYMINRDQVLNVDLFPKVVEIVNRLKTNEPFQYIVGNTSFYDLEFIVSPAVLIPRPETEELVQLIVKEYKNRLVKILDIGTGSACIAIALAANLPMAKVYATDISSAALEVAKLNAIQNKVEVSFFESDILNYKNNEILNQHHFDLIVSNPPYVRMSEKSQMQANVLDFEPNLALFVSDNDPLIFYRTIAQYGNEKLNKGGQLFFEINEYLGSEMNVMLESLNYTGIEIRKDINNRNRMMCCNLKLKA